LLDLDDPVSDYLDYFPAQYPITVRHLLGHSSGLPEPPDYIWVGLRLDGQPPVDPDVIDRTYYEQVPSLMFEPGSDNAYVNTDMVTLGQIVAEVSGLLYTEYVQEHILAPLGMENTDFTYSSDAMIANAAAGAVPLAQAEVMIAVLDEARGNGADFFRETDDQYAWMNRINIYQAGGGLIGPPIEAIRFAQMVLNGGELDGVRILSPESAALMREVPISTSGEPLDFGLAWQVIADSQHPYIQHDGGGPGITTRMRLYHQDGFAIILMSNGTGFDRGEVVDAAANVIFSMLAPPEADQAFTPPITDADGNEIPGSIAAIETVTLGGFEQTITLRGVDTTKPVLLFLHGGPGVPSAPWVTWDKLGQAELEANFVVVHWDQRGAGKSFSEALTPEDMLLENFVSDTLALTDILRERFEQDKI
ncbi:MAG: serine hydrolase, partial [Lysobacterales bacterium]